MLRDSGSGAIWGDDKVQRVFFVHVAQMDSGRRPLGTSWLMTCESGIWRRTTTWVPGLPW